MKSDFLNFFKEAFSKASTSEKKGFLVLVLFSFVVVLIQFSLKIYEPKVPENIVEMEVQSIANDSIVTLDFKSNFYINPNLVSEDTIQLLGLSDYSVQDWKTKQEKGFVFRDEIDVLRIKGLTKKQFFLLEKHLTFSGEKRMFFPKSYPSYKKENYNVSSQEKAEVLLQFELNEITSEELARLQIRPFIADRLLKFREKLGGFVRLDQLKDVYGISDTELKILQKQPLNKEKIRFIDVRKGAFKEILKHPYLDFEHVKIVVKYRDTTKSYQKSVLLKILPDSVSTKVSAYLQN